jgi:hypothetical protein
MAQKNRTIETLAEMINEGFKTTASKEDIKEVTTGLDGVLTRAWTRSMRGWEESRQTCTRCAMKWCISASLRMCLTA